MPNKNLKIIRLLIAASFFLYAFYFFYPFLYEYIYDDSVLRYLFNWPIEPFIAFPPEFYYIFLIFRLFSSVMIFYELLHAKWFFLVFTISSMVASAQSGMMVLTHLEIPIFMLLCMIDGVIIFMIFCVEGRGKNISNSSPQ